MPLRKISITPVALSSSMKTGMGTRIPPSIIFSPTTRMANTGITGLFRPKTGMELGCTNQYGAIWEGRLYMVAKQEKDPGATIVGGRISIADASTMKLIKQLQLIDPSGNNAMAEPLRSNVHKRICIFKQWYLGSQSGDVRRLKAR